MMLSRVLFDEKEYSQKELQEIANALLNYFDGDQFKLVKIPRLKNGLKGVSNERRTGDKITNFLKFRDEEFEYVLLSNQEIVSNRNSKSRLYHSVVFQVLGESDLEMKDKVLQKALGIYRGRKEEKQK